LIADFPQIFLVFPSILFYGRSHNPPREKIWTKIFITLDNLDDAQKKLNYVDFPFLLFLTSFLEILCIP
jgi:hypothetical protein